MGGSPHLEADSAGGDWINREWFLFTPSVAMNYTLWIQPELLRKYVWGYDLGG
jgi:hypothetical protein